MADFQENGAELTGLGARVVALSVDSADDARGTVERHGLDFPVLHGLDARATAARIGCYLNPDPLYLQPTGVVLRPDGTIAHLTYSSGPIGRLVAQDTARLVGFLQKKA